VGLEGCRLVEALLEAFQCFQKGFRAKNKKNKQQTEKAIHTQICNCKKDSGLAHRKPGYVEIDCTDPALLRSWSASQVYFAADAVATAAGQLAAGTMSKGDFDEFEKSVGINNGNGMLMSKLLRCCATARPCAISLYDLVAFPL
jgi:hypothetical protein